MATACSARRAGARAGNTAQAQARVVGEQMRTACHGRQRSTAAKLGLQVANTRLQARAATYKSELRIRRQRRVTARRRGANTAALTAQQRLRQMLRAKGRRAAAGSWLRLASEQGLCLAKPGPVWPDAWAWPGPRAKQQPRANTAAAAQAAGTAYENGKQPGMHGAAQAATRLAAKQATASLASLNKTQKARTRRQG